MLFYHISFFSLIKKFYLFFSPLVIFDLFSGYIFLKVVKWQMFFHNVSFDDTMSFDTIFP